MTESQPEQPTQPSAPKSQSSAEVRRGIAFLAIVVAAVTAWIAAPRVMDMISPPAELPNAGMTLTAAVEAARERGVPVVAVATQPGCPPCRALERGALSDERVQAWLQDNAIFVKVDTSVDPNDAAALGTMMTPTTYMINGYQIEGQFTGSRSASDVLAWLESTKASIVPEVRTVPAETNAG